MARKEKSIRQRVIVQVLEDGFLTVETLGTEITLQKAATRLNKLQRELVKSGSDNKLELILR